MAKAARFDGVDFSAQPVIKLTPSLANKGAGFRCERGEFVSFWRGGKIRKEEDTNVSRCWYIEGNGHLAGYITLLADKLELEQPPLEDEGIKYKTVPAIKIGWLAVDERTKGKFVGTRLVDWAIEYSADIVAKRMGVRFMTVDSFFDRDPDSNGKHYDASRFYKSMGFNFANPEETLPPVDGYRTMYLDLKPFIDAFSEPTEVPVGE